MTPINYLISYVLTFTVFLAIDMLWLGLIAKSIYQKYMGHLMTDTINWPAAFAFYFLFIAGLFVFVIMPAVEKESLQKAILLGAFFGLITYATYDLTNLATLRGFPAGIVWIDLVWGTFLTAIVSAAGYSIVMKVN